MGSSGGPSGCLGPSGLNMHQARSHQGATCPPCSPLVLSAPSPGSHRILLLSPVEAMATAPHIRPPQLGCWPVTHHWGHSPAPPDAGSGKVLWLPCAPGPSSFGMSPEALECPPRGEGRCWDLHPSGTGTQCQPLALSLPPLTSPRSLFLSLKDK